MQSGGVSGREASVRPPFVELAFGKGDVNLAAISVGALVWKTDDPALRKRLERTFGDAVVRQRSPLSVEIRGEPGLPLSVRFEDDRGPAVEVASGEPLQAAVRHSLTVELVRQQFGRLGGTPFFLDKVSLVGPSGHVGELPVMAPKSVLNELRRRAVEQLIENRRASCTRREVDTGALDELRRSIAGTDYTQLQRESLAGRTGCSALDTEPPVPSTEDSVLNPEYPVSSPEYPVPNTEYSVPGLPPSESHAARPTCVLQQELPYDSSGPCEKPHLSVLCRTVEQLRAVLDGGNSLDAALAGGAFPLELVYCDFEDVRRYRDAVAMCREAGTPVALATPRIIKPAEEGLLLQIASCRPHGVLVRNLAALEYFRDRLPELCLFGDYSLNVANELTADLLTRAGVVRLTPGYDLNLSQLEALLSRSDASLFEVVLHQHIPMFHMEHCVFSHVLSNGKDFHDCGRPCDRHRVELRDHVGEAHPLSADVGCRNTVFQSWAQSAAPYVPRLIDRGVRRFRVELLREDGHQTAALLNRSAQVLAGAADEPASRRGLRVLNQVGLTGGTFEFE